MTQTRTGPALPWHQWCAAGAILAVPAADLEHLELPARCKVRGCGRIAGHAGACEFP